MPKIGKKQSVRIVASTDIEKMFDNLNLYMRNKTLRLAVSRASKVVSQKAKAMAPVGNPDHHPEAESLRNSIGHVVREYQGGRVFVGYIGPTSGSKGVRPGAHAHLLEFGHKVRSRGPNRKGMPPLTGRSSVPGRRFFKRAVISTRQKQADEIERTIKEALKKQTQTSWR